MVKIGKELPSLQISTHLNRQKVGTKFEPYLKGQALIVKDLTETERSVIIHIQRQAFPAEIAHWR